MASPSPAGTERVLSFNAPAIGGRKRGRGGNGQILDYRYVDFVEGPLTFAVEVRSKNDDGNAVEAELASKRADDFLD